MLYCVAFKRHPWQICIVLASDLNFRVIYLPVLPAFDMYSTKQGMVISSSSVVRNDALVSVKPLVLKTG